MANYNKTLRWIAVIILIILIVVFLLATIMVSRSAGFGLHASVYLVVSLLLFFLTIRLVRKI